MADYDAYDAYWCRKFLPITNGINTLLQSGNRYHEMLAARIADTKKTRWLIKPAGGFTNDTHKNFFNASYNKNVLRGIAHVVSNNSGFIDGNVYSGDPLASVSDRLQPISGTSATGADMSRELFEAWWKNNKGFRAAWRVMGIVRKMRAGDKMYAYYNFSPSDSQYARIVETYPGWRPDDGSVPRLYF